MSVNARDAVIVDYARSAMGRSKEGCFRNVRADDLSVAVIKGLLARNEKLDPAEIDDLIWRMRAGDLSAGGGGAFLESFDNLSPIREARWMAAAETSGISPNPPCTLASAPSTSIIARTSALSVNRAPTSASPKSLP